MKPYDAVPFTNKHGHVLNPGDPAVAVTKSAGQPSLQVGKYLGTRVGRNRWNQTRTQVVMEVNKTSWKWDGKEYQKNSYLGTTTLQNNNIFPGDIALRNVKL